MNKLLFCAILFCASLLTINAQELLTPSKTFSHKKTAYVTLKNGTEIKGNIADLDREKGLIEQVKIQDGNGKKHKLKPEDIQFMYLPPSGLDKLSNAYGALTEVRKWTNEKLEQDLLNQGYVYFEQSDVKIKKKTETLLVQLLNPGFSGKIKVYHDPKSKETMSLGVAGIDVVGGLLKSYYVKKEGETAAFKLTKSDYKKEFSMFWSDCDAITSEFGTTPEWSDFTKHILKYYDCH